jgi:hypothetical protein
VIRRLALACVLATACAGVFATRVFTDVEAVRVIARGTPLSPASGVAHATVDDERVGALPSPFAIIARIRNGASSARTFSIAADGAVVCAATIPAGASRRVDCAQPADGVDNFSARHDIDITSDGSDWTVESLELATYHGRSSGLLTAFILPSHLDRYVRPTTFWTLVAWLVIAAAFALPLPHAPSASRADALIVRALAAAIPAIFIGVIVMPLVSPYVVVLSAGTFFGWLGALTLARVSAALGRDGRRRLLASAGPDTRAARWQVAAAGVIAGAVFLSFAFHLVSTRHRNVSGLVQISPSFFDKNPFVRDDEGIRARIAFVESGGYDGQFFYHMTFDPLLTRFRNEPERYHEYIDTPPYRYGRIGFSAMTRILSAGAPQRYPAVMVTLVIGSLAVCGALLAAFARRHGHSPWGGLLIVLIPGYWSSAELTLPEPIAAAFLLAAYLCLLQRSWLAAGALFGGSLLVRETGAPIVLALVAGAFLPAPSHTEPWTFRSRATLALLAFLPLALWKLFVGVVFFTDWGWEAFTHRPDNFGVPLRGVAEMWTHIASGTYGEGQWEAARAGMAFSLLLGAAIALVVVSAIKRPSPLAVAGLVYAAMTVSLNYRSIWISVLGAQRLTIELFLVLALVCLSLPRDSRGLVWAFRTFWTAAALYVFFGTYNALDTLAALFP